MKSITFDKIEHNGVVLNLKSPINAFLTVSNKDDGKQFWICEYSESNFIRVVGWGGSEKEAISLFQEDFIFAYKDIECEKDHNLTFNAREFKNRILEQI
jgi:hypothetical protein